MVRHQHRKGKIVRGPHSTAIEGLMSFLARIEPWPEIRFIHVGPLSTRNTVGRKSKKLRPVTTDTDTREFIPVRGHKRAKSGGGFAFKATRWAMTGTKITGIKCDASRGRSVQTIILTSHDLGALKRRLEKEGYCEGW